MHRRYSCTHFSSFLLSECRDFPHNPSKAGLETTNRSTLSFGADPVSCSKQGPMIPRCWQRLSRGRISKRRHRAEAASFATRSSSSTPFSSSSCGEGRNLPDRAFPEVVYDCQTENQKPNESNQFVTNTIKCTPPNKVGIAP